MDQYGYLGRILRARVYDVAVETPLDFAPRLSGRLGQRVWLKREGLQPVFTFKIRGASNMLAGLSPEALAKGVVTYSSGNHGQAVALAAKLYGVQSTIVMPTTVPCPAMIVSSSNGGTIVSPSAFWISMAFSIRSAVVTPW